MIPLRDDAPCSTTPYVNYFLIIINVLVFMFELSVPATPVGRASSASLCMPNMVLSERDVFTCNFGYVPDKVTALLRGMPSVTAAQAFVPVLTSMFMHATFIHLIGNMWFLWIFGDNVEDHLGHLLYLVMYLLSGIAGSFVHTLFNATSFVPSVGASGAIAGVMGAYFVLYPRARVLTLVPFFFIYFVRLPAWVMLGYWFVYQFLSGAATSIATASQQSGGGVAFWAHVGGFVAGIAMIKLFPSRPRRYESYAWR